MRCENALIPNRPCAALRCAARLPVLGCTEEASSALSRETSWPCCRLPADWRQKVSSSGRRIQDGATRLRRGAFALTDAGTAQGAEPRQQFSVRKPISAFMPS